jgi:hypothetical protein
MVHLLQHVLLYVCWQVWDKDSLKPDDLIGEVELPVKTIVTWVQCGARGWRDGWWRLAKPKTRLGKLLLGGSSHQDQGSKEKGAGRIEMKVHFRPYAVGSSPGR